MKFYRIYLWVLFTTLGLSGFLYFLVPDLRPLLMDEDQLVENITVLFYIATLLYCLSGLTIFSRPGKRRWLVVLGMAALAGALDELSYGERLLQLHMPVLAGVKIDALHDFFFIGVRGFCRTLIRHAEVAVPIFISIGVISTLYVWKNRVSLSTFFRRLWSHEAIRILLIGILAAFLAQVIDLDRIHVMILFLFEEILEKNLAIALLFSAIASQSTPRIRRHFDSEISASNSI